MQTTGYFPAHTQLLSVRGKDSLDYLHRMLTCNIKALQTGQVIPGALLNAMGRIVAPFLVYSEGDSYILETPEACAEALQMRLERYVFSEDVTINLESRLTLRIISPGFAQIPQPGTYVDFEFGGQLVRLGTAHEEDYRLHALASFNPNSLNVPALSEGEFTAWRIEQGLSEWGHELNDSLIPLNLGIDQAFDHDKGCYTGQEVISRLTYVGHPPLQLIGLRAQSELAQGSELTVNGTSIGEVTSVSYSAEQQAFIGLARIRWQKVKPGDRALASGQEVEAVALPFGSQPRVQIQSEQ